MVKKVVYLFLLPFIIVAYNINMLKIYEN